ncbi:hypothetical protein ABZ572_37805 [Streptomyces sp. NPDC018338]|uniref:hypothetical protein n=1 Tax=Streptomyces sp. NPDC018338 TaxID=3157192 RepID=UPI0033EBDAAA
MASADEPTTRALTVAGRYAGNAVQLHYNLLPAFGDPEVTSKPAGEDIPSGEATYLLPLAHSRARATGSTAVTGLLRSSRETARFSATDPATVREVLRSTGSGRTAHRAPASSIGTPHGLGGSARPRCQTPQRAPASGDRGPVARGGRRPGGIRSQDGRPMRAGPLPASICPRLGRVRRTTSQ